jgi:GAF domain
LRVTSSASQSQGPQELASAVFRALAEGIGACDCQVRLLTSDEAAGEVVLERLATSGSGWEATPACCRRGEGVAGRMWQAGALGYDDAAAAGLGPADDLPGTEGSGLCLPLRAQGGLLGTLHVHRANRWALSPADLAFLHQIADWAGPALGRAAEQDARAGQLVERALQALGSYLTAPRAQGPTAIQEHEACLLAAVAEPLLRDLGSGPSWLWVADPQHDHLRCFRAEGIDGAVPEPVAETVAAELGQQAFIVVSDPTTDKRLAALVDIFPEPQRSALAASPLLAIAIPSGRPLALLFAVVRRPTQVSRSRIEPVARALDRMGQLFLLMRGASAGRQELPAGSAGTAGQTQ